MTGRQRLQALLNRQPTDRLAWTTLVDGITRSVMPESVRGLSSPEFCRHIGCDILQFGNYDLPADCRVISPARLVRPESEVRATTDADGVRTTVTCTAWGDLTATHKGSHPLKHPVTTREELRVLRNLWAESRYEEVEGHEASFARAEAFLGDDGLYLPTLEPSPVQQLLELDMGVIGFYHLLADYPREVEELLEIMQAARVQEYELLCRRTPAPAIIPVENTSSTLISPKLYRQYSLPQLRQYVEIAHRHGKQVVLHMCGLLFHLLDDIRETGCDGINALTPAPVGDTTVETVLDRYGEDFLVLGTMLPGDVFQRPGVTGAEIQHALTQYYTPRLRRANVLLWLAADGLATPLERFLAARDWYEAHGAR